MPVTFMSLALEQERRQLSFKPFKCVLIADHPVTDEWRERVSAWLVGSGCLYLMARGADCAAWHDAVDQANIAEFAPADIPTERLVMTTSHEHERLPKTLWFAANCADHPAVELRHTLILHIAAKNHEAAVLHAIGADLVHRSAGAC